MKITTVSVFIGLLGSLSAQAAGEWYIKKDAWTAADERGYSEFVAALGNSGCNTVHRCLTSPANPYRNTDPAGIRFYADCGKFPYLLRAYYAWKNNLPFSFAADMAAVGSTNDLRYSKNGNYVIARLSNVQTDSMRPLNGAKVIFSVVNEVNTAMYRVHPLRDDRKFADFYPVGIDRSSVRPGTILYDASGHVVVVYKVEQDGRVRYFDAHPDYTVSRGVFGEKFARSRPASGAGFKNWRPLRLVGYRRGFRGELIGGQIESYPLKSLPGFSVEQYWGTSPAQPYNDSDWTRARFSMNGRNMNYYDFVRSRLAIGALKFHPVIEMKNAMEALCGDLKDRADAINVAIETGIQRSEHPSRLPNNIYGTSGDWEEYSSPSRDARLKVSFRELRVRVQKMIELYRAGDPSIDYTGVDLPGELRETYSQAAAACEVTYRRTNGQLQSLSYDEIVKRLFALSFDPYHCIELRWGARSGEEFSSCPDSNNKLDWYDAEQRLRNQLERTYDTPMGFSLIELRRSVPGSGVDTAPDVDLRGYLETL